MHGECVQKYKLGNVNNFNLYKNRYCTDVKLTVYQMNTHHIHADHELSDIYTK